MSWTSGYHFNDCGCAHLPYVASWDKHQQACKNLLSLLHKLLHTKPTIEELDEIDAAHEWDDDGDIL